MNFKAENPVFCYDLVEFSPNINVSSPKLRFSPPRSGGLVNCGYAFMGTGTNMIFRTDLKNTLYPIPISDIILKPSFLELIFHSVHDGEGPSSKLFLDQDFDFCPPKFRVPRVASRRARARHHPTVQLCSTLFYFVLLCSTLFFFVLPCSALFHFVLCCCSTLFPFVHFCTSCSPGIELART